MPAQKKPGCDHQFAAEPDCAPAIRNTYECDCGATWEDIWSCACDDECPECGTDIEPSKSVEIAPCACEYGLK